MVETGYKTQPPKDQDKPPQRSLIRKVADYVNYLGERRDDILVARAIKSDEEKSNKKHAEYQARINNPEYQTLLGSAKQKMEAYVYEAMKTKDTKKAVNCRGQAFYDILPDFRRSITTLFGPHSQEMEGNFAVALERHGQEIVDRDWDKYEEKREISRKKRAEAKAAAEQAERKRKEREAATGKTFSLRQDPYVIDSSPRHDVIYNEAPVPTNQAHQNLLDWAAANGLEYSYPSNPTETPPEQSSVKLVRVSRISPVYRPGGDQTSAPELSEEQRARFEQEQEQEPEQDQNLDNPES